MTIQFSVHGPELSQDVEWQIGNIFGGVDPPEYLEVCGRVLATDKNTGSIVGHAAWLVRPIWLIESQPESVLYTIVYGIADVFVVEHFRLRTIGTRLMKILLDQIPNDSPKMLFAEPGIRPFYTSLGFRHSHLNVYYMGRQGISKASTAMYMSLALPKDGVILMNAAAF